MELLFSPILLCSCTFLSIVIGYFSVYNSKVKLKTSIHFKRFLVFAAVISLYYNHLFIKDIFEYRLMLEISQETVSNHLEIVKATQMDLEELQKKLADTIEELNACRGNSGPSGVRQEEDKQQEEVAERQSSARNVWSYVQRLFGSDDDWRGRGFFLGGSDSRATKCPYSTSQEAVNALKWSRQYQYLLYAKRHKTIDKKNSAKIRRELSLEFHPDKLPACDPSLLIDVNARISAMR
jgi:hypothetical protein